MKAAMTTHLNTPLPTRRKRRGSAVMVWVFVLLAAGVFGVFMVQVSGFDIEQATTPKSAPVPTAKAPPSEQEHFAVKGSEVAGFDDDRQPYKIAAVEAKQDKDTPNLVHMRQITGLLRRADGRAMDVTAPSGIFNSKDKSLQLTGGVMIKMTDSFTANMDTATVDMKGKSLTSQADVNVVLNGGLITSTGIDVADNGAHVTFKSRVRAVFQSDDTSGDPASSPVANTTSSKGNLQE